MKTVVQNNGKPKILAVECDKTCPAGKKWLLLSCDGSDLETVHKISRKNTDEQDDRSGTSKPRKWEILGKGTAQHNPVMSQKLGKPQHASNASERKRRGAYPPLFDPRPSQLRNLDVESAGMLKQIKLQKVNPSVPFSKMIPDVNDIVLIDTILEEVAKGSVLQNTA